MGGDFLKGRASHTEAARILPVEDERRRLLRCYPQRVRSERANRWDQNRETFQWHKALKSEVKKKNCALTELKSKDVALFSFCQHFFAARGWGGGAMRAARPRY